MISIISGTSRRGARVDVRRDDVEVAHVVAVHVDVLLDEFVGRDLQAVRALDDAVVDVGEVLDVLDLEARST